VDTAVAVNPERTIDAVLRRCGISKRDNDREDFEQVGRVAAWRALNTHDLSRGRTLESWTYVQVRNAVIDEIRTLRGRFNSRPTLWPWLDDEHTVEDPDPVFDEIEMLRERITKLPDRHRDIILRRLANEPIADISQSWGITDTRVWQLQRDAWGMIASNVFPPDTPRR
jgi:RNA polymerase sigma factor (sigma-70 family)